MPPGQMMAAPMDDAALPEGGKYDKSLAPSLAPSRKRGSSASDGNGLGFLPRSSCNTIQSGMSFHSARLTRYLGGLPLFELSTGLPSRWSTPPSTARFPANGGLRCRPFDFWAFFASEPPEPPPCFESTFKSAESFMPSTASLRSSTDDESVSAITAERREAQCGCSKSSLRSRRSTAVHCSSSTAVGSVDESFAIFSTDHVDSQVPQERWSPQSRLFTVPVESLPR